MLDFSTVGIAFSASELLTLFLFQYFQNVYCSMNIKHEHVKFNALQGDLLLNARKPGVQ